MHKRDNMEDVHGDGFIKLEDRFPVPLAKLHIQLSRRTLEMAHTQQTKLVAKLSLVVPTAHCWKVKDCWLVPGTNPSS